MPPARRSSRSIRASLASLAASALGAGCSLFVGFERYAAGPDADAAVSADASSDPAFESGPAGDGDAGACPSGAGPKTVRVGSFCIDSTEVTQGDYSAFLVAVGSDAGALPAECAGKTSFAPNANVFVGPADAPVVGVDWCDAFAYCKWAGKRLCGKIGGGSVPRVGALPDDPATSQWFFACSNGGKNKYPYGSTYARDACNGEGSGGLARTASHPNCEGGFAGLFDMSGNVWEWEDACDDAGCAARGGAFQHGAVALECSHIATRFAPERTWRSGDVGLRCCGP